MADPLLDHLRIEMNYRALKYAVGTAISCPGCQRILDVDDAVLVTSTSIAIACGACFDAMLAEKNVTVETLIDLGVEIDDGRKLKTER